MSNLSIEEAQSFTPELARAMAELIPQVSESAPLPGEDELETIVSSPVTRLLLARDEAGSIVGTLTLVAFRIPTGVGAWIEDVVVDERARRRGVGEALIRSPPSSSPSRAARAT